MEAHSIKYNTGGVSSVQTLLTKPDDEIIRVISSGQEGNDIVASLRDAYSILRTPDMRTKIFGILKRVCTDVKTLDSSCRVQIPVTFYSLAEFTPALELMALLMNDETVLLDDRIECSRYEYASMEDDRVQLAQDFLLDVVQMPIDSGYRLKVIMGFVNMKVTGPSPMQGLAFKYTLTRLKIPRDEDFFYTLLYTFITCPTSEVRSRIIALDALLSLETLEDKGKIIDMLLVIAEDATLDMDTRADAADVIIRRTDDNVRARNVLATMRENATLYGDKQNVHNTALQTSIKEYLVKMVTSRKRPSITYQNVHIAVTALIKSMHDTKVITPEIRTKCHKALSRIEVDPATFTDLKLNMREIFIYIWDYIVNNKEHKKELEKRLVDELYDMGSTCASGHYARLVNVISVYEEGVTKISWFDQIKGNINGRVQALVRDCKDEKLKGDVICGMMDDADEKSRKIYKGFILKALPGIQKEMYKEFVGDGYMPRAEFEKYFVEAEKEWL